MERLRQSDFRRVLEFVEKLAVFQNQSTLRKNIVRALPALISADVHSVTETNHRNATAILEDAPGGAVMSQAELECYAQFSLQHPTIAYYQRTSDGQALKISDLLTSSAWEETDLYNYVYRPHRIKYNLGAGLSLSKEVVIGLGLTRGRKDFSERDRTIFNLIRPHLLYAYDNARVVSEMEQRIGALTKAVDQLDQAVVEVDEKGKIVWTTAKANTLLQKIEKRRKGHALYLPSIIGNWMRKWHKTFSDSSNIPVPIKPLKIETESSLIRIQLSQENGTTLLFLEEQLHELPVERLHSLGLTPRETEVLGWVAQGKANLEISDILGIGIGTVKTHLERIYVKLGVDHRHAAMSLALEVLHNGGKD